MSATLLDSWLPPNMPGYIVFLSITQGFDPDIQGVLKSFLRMHEFCSPMTTLQTQFNYEHLFIIIISPLIKSFCFSL